MAKERKVQKRRNVELTRQEMGKREHRKRRNIGRGQRKAEIEVIPIQPTERQDILKPQRVQDNVWLLGLMKI